MSKIKEKTESNLRLSHFTIERAPDSIFWLDHEGRIHRVNEAACQLSGYSQDELVGMKAYDLYREQDDRNWHETWQKLRDERVLMFEDYLFTKDGRGIAVETSMNFFEFEGEEYACGFVRDITERKYTAEALENALAEVMSLKNRLQRENLYLRQEFKFSHNFEEIVSQDEGFIEILSEVEQVASTEATVLILGETGTGKELIARAIHNISSRRERPLVKLNCATLPDSLIESELFGYEKGAFTGAIARKMGRFELANGTTIFLDEIGELPMESQVKLLRVLQEGEFERLGGSNTIKVDVRVIAATNRDLMKAMAEGRFREDLYYRLNIFPIHIPPLRERKGDIPLLVRYFVKKYSVKVGKQVQKVSQEVMDSLQNYNWPGNVRELENIIERAVIISRGKRLEVGNWLPRRDVPAEMLGVASLEEVEKAHILSVLESTRWRVSGEKGAAKILGVNPQTLFSKMRKMGINRTD